MKLSLRIILFIFAMTPQQYLTGIVAGGLIGGGVNGITALANGRTFMSGTIKPPPTSTVRPSLPSLNSSKPELNIEGMKAEIRRESIVIKHTTVSEPLQPGPIRVNMGNEVRYVDVKTANGIEISGFAKHGLNRAIERGVKPNAILDAVKNPLKTGNVVTDQLGRQSQRFIGKFAEVVINPQTGQIISVNPTSSSKAANLLRIGQ